MVRASQRCGWRVVAVGVLSMAAAGTIHADLPSPNPEDLLSDGDRYRDVGDYLAALEAYELAAEAARLDRRDDLEATSLTRRGVILKRQGWHYQAVSHHLQALELCRRLEDRACEAEPLHNLGSCYIHLGDFEAALDALQDAMERWTTSFEKSVTLTAIGTLYDLQGDSDSAIQELRRAFELRLSDPEVDPKVRQRGRATTLDRLATAFKSAGEMDKARQAYESSLSISQTLGSHPDIALVSDNLGWLYVDWERPRDALSHFDQALALFEQLGRPHAKAHTLLGLAHAHRQLKDLVSATTFVEEAIGIIESLRSTSHSQRMRTSFLATRQPYFELYIDVLMQRHEKQPESGFRIQALEAAEQFKARSFLDRLYEEREALLRGADEVLRQAEEDLHRQMILTDRERLELIHRKAPPEDLARVEKERRRLALDYENLEARVRSRHTVSEPAPLGYREMQKLLDEETLLLVYSLGEQRSFLWAVSDERILSFRLASREVIEDQARQAYDWLRNSDQRSGAEQGQKAVDRLSEMLLGQVRDVIAERRLVIVPDGGLHYVPFSALSSPGGHHMVRDHEIITLPSVSVLAALRSRAAGRGPATKRLAVMADPVFRLEDRRMPEGIDPSRSEDSNRPAPERLQHSSAEAEAILKLVEPRERFEALGFDADRRRVLAGVLQDHGIVHFAVHGEVDDQRPEFSHLVLSLVDRQGKSVDGRLYLHEIDDLQWAADLVVLSACNTALGRRVRGEGIVGLTRGFMNGGASSVVVSLWYVNDAATAELMADFYHEMLVVGRQPAAALRVAQARMRQSSKWRAPYFWAGFVVQGDSW